MKCYIQFFDDSGNHAAPMPDDYEACDSLRDARAAFGAWVDEVGQYTDPQHASALVFYGEPEGVYPCDCYPDATMAVGPRGGIIMARA